MKWWKNLLKGIQSVVREKGKSVREADELRAALSIEGGIRSAQHDEAKLEELTRDILQWSSRQRHHRVREEVSRQVAELIRAAVESGGAEVYPTMAVDDETADELDEKAQIAELEKRRRRAIHQTLVSHPSGCVLQVRTSSIEHESAGWGVFVRGRLPMGQIVGFYPGPVYPALMAAEIARGRSLENGQFAAANDYLFARLDGYVIDGLSPEIEAAERRRRRHRLARGLLSVDPGSETLARLRNPYALGALINHPPPGKHDNVMPVTWNLLESDIVKWKWNEPMISYIPNYTPPKKTGFGSFSFLDGLADRSVRSRGLVLLAVRDIEDEEVFLNYRYNPLLPRPDWYQPVNLGVESARWLD